MKNKIFLISLLTLMFSFGFVMAANTATLNYPSADLESATGTIVVNATLDTNAVNLTNATFYYRIDNGGTATAWTTIGSQIVNVTADQTEWNTTFDTTGIVDTINMTFNVTITDNEGRNITSDNNINISIDNGNPTATLASTSLAAATQLYLDNVFTLALDADSDIGIESCTAYFGTTSGTVTASAEACSIATYTPGSFGLSGGDYTYYITATDDNGDATNSSSRTIQIFNTNSLGGGGGSDVTEPVDTTPTNGVLENGVSAPSERFIVWRIIDKFVNFFRNLF